jgi:glycosyltransferase involved in cell wall biosynthesis
MRKPIALVEPVAQQRLSGGYRYNDEVSAVLEARGLGGLTQIDRPDALHTVHADTLVIDSLWLGSARPSTLSSDTVVLGHYFPPDNPLLSGQQKKDWLATAGDWVNRSRALLVTGISARDSWRPHFPDTPMHIVPPAVVTRPKIGHASSGQMRLFTLGSVLPAKMPLALFEAMAHLCDEDFEWLIAGSVSTDSQHLRACRDCLAATGLTQRIRFIGPLPPSRVPEALAQADIYLAPSLFESFGMASAEALASGLPLIGFDTGDLGKWLPKDDACALLTVGDYSAFAEQVAAWLRRGRPGLPSPGTPRLPARDWTEVANRFVAAVGLA